MESARRLVNENKMDRPHRLDLQQSDLKKTKQLIFLDQSGLNKLGLFRSQLNKLKSEMHQSKDAEATDEILNSYNYLFEINGQVEFKKNHSLAEHIGELFILMGTLGVTYDFTYGTSSITSILSWTSFALGIFTRFIARMLDDTDLQIKKLSKIEKQIQQPLYKIIEAEKLPEFKDDAYHYLQTRVRFFKTNSNSMNTIMKSYPTPTCILRLMLDCYHVVQSDKNEDITDIRQMIDDCFKTLNGKFNATQEALFNEFCSTTNSVTYHH